MHPFDWCKRRRHRIPRFSCLIDVDDGVAKATIGGAMQYTQTEEAPKTSSLILKEEEQNAYQ